MKRSLQDTIFSIRNLNLTRDTSASFEFFPPKSEELEDKLWQTIKTLAPIEPSFVSVTYGAGGSTRERTHSTLQKILDKTNLTPAAHLTCVGASKDEINEIAKGYWDMGVKHIVALRGDSPAGAGGYEPHPEGYRYSVDLVYGLKKLADFEIAVAAYPEGHPESKGVKDDIEILKMKQDAGANCAITQYFFDVELFMRFYEKARKAGITIDIVPGILPVTNYAQVIKFSKMCGASVPKWMEDIFYNLDDEPITRNLVAATVAAEQCRLLHSQGFRDFHFYTLNRAELTRAICRILGIDRDRWKAEEFSQDSSNPNEEAA